MIDMTSITDYIAIWPSCIKFSVSFRRQFRRIWTHGGNVEPRVAAAWMQGRSTLQATDVQTRCRLRSVHKVQEDIY